MGSSASCQKGQEVPPDAVGKLVADSKKKARQISSAEAQKLRGRFSRLADAQGRVDIAQFHQMVELGGNPFIGHILSMFDTDGDHKITAAELNAALEYFAKLSEDEDQHKFAFGLYDQDKDGVISGAELSNMLSTLLGKAYTPSQLEQVVLHTLREYDKDGDSGLNMDEFRGLLSANDIINKLSMY